MEARVTFVYALSPLHAGVGQGAGVIDLPAAREKATGIPYLPGSSLKGALRTRCVNTYPKLYRQIFGPDEPDSENNAASMIVFSDQRLLLLPVRSLTGTFAWVTSPYLLSRLKRDMEDIGMNVQHPAIPALSLPEEEGKDEELVCYIPTNSALVRQGISGIYLEDLDLPYKARPEANQWAEQIGKWVFSNESDTTWRTMLNDHFCIVPDRVCNFLYTTATEIIARIRLKEGTKTVEQGGLWYEEALPTETILSGIALVTPRANGFNTGEKPLPPERVFPVIEELTSSTLQLGGKATVGRGFCRVVLPKGESNDANT